MPEFQTVSVALTDEDVAALETAVASGEYAATSEIIREAMIDWRRKRELYQADTARLRQAWEAGKASGPSQPFDIERIIVNAQARLKDHAAE